MQKSTWCKVIKGTNHPLILVKSTNKLAHLQKTADGNFLFKLGFLVNIVNDFSHFFHDFSLEISQVGGIYFDSKKVNHRSIANITHVVPSL